MGGSGLSFIFGIPTGPWSCCGLAVAAVAGLYSVETGRSGRQVCGDAAPSDPFANLSLWQRDFRTTSWASIPAGDRAGGCLHPPGEPSPRAFPAASPDAGRDRGLWRRHARCGAAHVARVSSYVTGQRGGGRQGCRVGLPRSRLHPRLVCARVGVLRSQALVGIVLIGGIGNEPECGDCVLGEAGNIKTAPPWPTGRYRLAGPTESVLGAHLPIREILFEAGDAFVLVEVDTAMISNLRAWHLQATRRW